MAGQAWHGVAWRGQVRRGMARRGKEERRSEGAAVLFLGSIMDQQERLDDREASLRAALQGWQSELWTALPAILQTFDPDKMVCVAQPSIQATVTAQDGTWLDVNLPVLLDCPVIFPSGGGFALTFPLAAGDEGLVVFASRCIDAWWAQGGIQKQARFRMHDLSDGFFLPGCFSQPSKLANVSTTKPQLRTADGVTFLEIDPGAARVNIAALGGLWVNGVRVNVP